jgi:predicted SprT family Zn-dependent metalloprotease
MSTNITKQEVKNIYFKVFNWIKENYPKYYELIKDYKFAFGRKKRAYATCYCKEQMIRVHMYSSQLLNAEEMEQTIRHEFAHAVEYAIHGSLGTFVNGRRDPHGKRWQNYAYQLGVKKPAASKRSSKRAVRKSKYVLVCNIDGKFEYVRGYHRKTSTFTVGQYMDGFWLTGRKETKGNLVVIDWSDFEEHLENDNIIIPEKYTK